MSAQDIRYDRLGYVALNVTDLERSSRFYDDVLGLQRVPSALDDPVFFAAGPTTTTLSCMRRRGRD